MNLAASFPGDYQFDVYRMMRELIRGAWEEFHPITNILVGCFLSLTRHSLKLDSVITVVTLPSP